MLFRIREARERCGLTQAALAEKLGVNGVTLSGYENGKHDPKSDTLVKIAQICGVSVDYLLGREQESTHTEILYISKPSGDMKADEVRKFLHELIDELKDEDLLFMKDFSLRMVRKETAYATERKPKDCSF